MKITVLGKYSPFPAPGGCCLGYLVESENVSFVIDMGSGTLGRLLKLRPKLDIDALILTNLKSDHASDALVLRYALMHLNSSSANTPLPLTTLLPSTPEAQFRELSSSGVFDMLKLEDAMRIRFKDMTVTFHLMMQQTPSYAVTIEKNGSKLVYTSDSGASEKLEEICKNADLLLADTCLVHCEKNSDMLSHMTPMQAATIALNANVKQLICTNIFGTVNNDEQILKEVTGISPAATVAQEMHTYTF